MICSTHGDHYGSVFCTECGFQVCARFDCFLSAGFKLAHSEDSRKNFSILCSRCVYPYKALEKIGVKSGLFFFVSMYDLPLISDLHPDCVLRCYNFHEWQYWCPGDETGAGYSCYNYLLVISKDDRVHPSQIKCAYLCKDCLEKINLWILALRVLE
jgi:hypothetical protein